MQKISSLAGEREGVGGVKDSRVVWLLRLTKGNLVGPGLVRWMMGEDAQCVSSNPLKAFWWLEWVNSLCAKGVEHVFPLISYILHIKADNVLSQK